MYFFCCFKSKGSSWVIATLINSTDILKSVRIEEAKLTLEWELQEDTIESILLLKFWLLCALKMEALLKVVRTGVA